MEQQRKWVFDLNEANTAAVEPPHGYFAGSDRLAEQISASSSSSAATTSSSSSSSGNASTSELKLKKAWELAYSPGKSIFMTAFMMWMSGSSVNIFSIMITIYSFWNPFKAILQVNNAFSKYGADSGSGAQQQQHNQKLLSAKLVFILFNLLSAGIAVYKGYTLGILPTTPADWLQFSGAGTASSIQTSTYAAGMEL